jgi:hypothetical protein
MFRILFLIGLLTVVILFAGCARGGGFYLESTWGHIEHHFYRAYTGLESIHQFIDRHIFNLDIEDPDSY